MIKAVEVKGEVDKGEDAENLNDERSFGTHVWFDSLSIERLELLGNRFLNKLTSLNKFAF